MFDELARHADVIALDLPGFGLSSKPEHGYNADSMALSVLRLLDQFGLERAVFVGHSLRGAVAAAVAVQSPERVLGLILVVAYYRGLRSRFAGIHDPDWLAESAAADPSRDRAPILASAPRGATAQRRGFHRGVPG